MAIEIDFDAPYDVQITQARTQGVLLSDVYYGLLPEEKRKYAQTISDITKFEQIQSIVDRLVEVQAKGETLSDLKKWAEKQNWALPKGRVETIYRASVQTAYAAGHWRDFEENKQDRPYLMFDAINDSRVRPSHLALDGIIKPVDDKFWNTHSVPLGFNCRCSIRSITYKQAMRKGGVTQNVPAEGGPDKGWGSKPDMWGTVLRELEKDKKTKWQQP